MYIARKFLLSCNFEPFYTRKCVAPQIAARL